MLTSLVLAVALFVIAFDPTQLTQADQLLRETNDDLASYQGAVAIYDAMIAAGDAPSSVYGHEAQAYLRLGDLISAEKDEDKKLATYKKGQAIADAGIAKDARCASCWFWHGATLGRWGETRGIMQSLFILGDVKTAFQKVLSIEPDNEDATLSLALIDAKVPGFAGGSIERAEAAMRKVVAKLPKFTRARLDLAEVLWDDGKKDEAKALAAGVVVEKDPLHRGEWRKFDVKRAQKLLASWQ
jgi:tetratricopeptide (TPR) repeat protein